MQTVLTENMINILDRVSVELKVTESLPGVQMANIKFCFSLSKFHIKSTGNSYWLSHYAASRKVAGSIPGEVDVLIDLISSPALALGST
jgi:hypothetical protein